MTPKTEPSLDLGIVQTKKIAGVHHTRIYNNWVNCEFEVGRGQGRGYYWYAVLRTNGAEPSEVLSGSGTTRQGAFDAAVDAITKRIFKLAEQRRLMTFGTTALEPLAPEVVGRGLRGLLERARRVFARAWARHLARRAARARLRESPF